MKYLFLGMFLTVFSFPSMAEQIEKEFFCYKTAYWGFPIVNAKIQIEDGQFIGGIGEFSIQVDPEKVVHIEQANIGRGMWTIHRLTAHKELQSGSSSLFFIADDYFQADREPEFEAQIMIPEVALEDSELTCFDKP